MFKVDNLLVVGDPCYEGNHSAHLTTLSGEWHSYVEMYDAGDWGVRCSKLKVWHESWKDVRCDTFHSDLGVDSGQMGAFINPNEMGGEYQQDSFYGECCNLTIASESNPTGWGELSHHGTGVVSGSGFGDGAYPLKVKYVNSLVVAIEVDFLCEPDDDEDELLADEDDE